MTKIGIAKPAYRGAPRPLGDNVLGNEAMELRSKAPKWNFKTKKVRRQEMLLII